MMGLPDRDRRQIDVVSRVLKQPTGAREGGSIEAWLLSAAEGRRLAPAVLHPAAAQVLERPVDRLWPLGPDS